MPQEVNILDPLGIAKVVRGQVNQMATQAKLPALPELPSVSVKVGPVSLFNPFNKIPNRPGLGREERAG